MGNIHEPPTVAPTPRPTRLRRVWDSFVSEHVLEVEPDWNAWPETLRTTVPTRAMVVRKAS